MSVNTKNIVIYFTTILILVLTTNFSQMLYKERKKILLKNTEVIIKIGKLNENYYQTILALSKENECKEKADKILQESVYLNNIKK
jgi:hypothetical protein